MIRFFLLLYAVLFLSSCSFNRQLLHELDRAEEMLDSNPDTALNVLNGIDISSNYNLKYRARYSLLMAAALDKNYIDVLSDSVISPAVSYYRYFGSAEEKLKTLYYRGIVERNCENWEDAMSYFVKAEKYCDRSADPIMSGRLHNAKMHIYKQFFDFEKALREGETAANYYLAGRDTNRFITALLDVAVSVRGVDDTTYMRHTIARMKSFLNKMTPVQKSRYYSLLLFDTSTDNGNEVSRIVERYIHDIKETSLVNWLIIAQSYHMCGEVEKALSALRLFESENKPPLYHKIAANIYSDLERYEQAVKEFTLYLSQTSDSDARILISDVRFIEERYKSHIAKVTHKYVVIVLILILLIVIMGCIIAFKYYKIMKAKRVREITLQRSIIESLNSEKDKFQNLYNKALLEQKRLQRLRSEKVLSKEVMELIEERFNVLNKFFVANISRSFSKTASSELQNLMNDQDYFMNSTRLTFAITHHSFIKYLHDRGLTDWEVGCCCLYCIGLNGSEIADYLKVPSYYKASGRIRKKLGLDRSINLDTYLTRIVAETKNRSLPL